MADSQVTTNHNVRLPRVTIKFCTQCKWNLRAAYFAQELLQTFSTTLGEVSLQPSSGGVFVVDITYAQPHSSSDASIVRHRVLWDRATDGGFPETKELKRRVRDVVEPERNLGHVDRDYPRKTDEPGKQTGSRESPAETTKGKKEHCEDCA
ncbi:hypothetical protein DL546_005859 [Coniochaeta pulveracea]|uniref:SelT/selW/selH selenoprotein domain-containing protein n=1 Tax=Coniochaeta pulveracea TaxID=177199 RepID=A0A420Y4W1_9PEZI|nr:hypothetical protein DL546_005859 [Coniochaeta pulveracea]